MLGAALQDADRLDALGSVGIARCLAVSAQLNAVLFDGPDPWAEHRELNDRRFSVDHFFTKLFKLPANMNTATGYKEAQSRVRHMRAFLQQLADELGVDLPETAEMDTSRPFQQR